MKTPEGRTLRFRCFLEGIEVPCVNASMQGTPNAPVVCAIQCVPTQSATRLHPRTGVEVFYSTKSDTAGWSEWNLFFTGEIISYTLTKNPVRLSVVYQCVDDSSYWDNALQYFTRIGELYTRRSTFLGSGKGLFDNLLREHSSVVAGLLRGRPDSYPELQGLVGGVVNVIEKVGGVQGRFKGFNDFFTMAEMRRQITAQIGASEADDSSARIFSHKVFWKWLMRGLGSQGSLVSVRDMIKLLFRYVFHDIVPCPIAKIEGTYGGTVKTRTTRFKYKDTDNGKKLIPILKVIQRDLTTIQNLQYAGLKQAKFEISRAINLMDKDVAKGGIPTTWDTHLLKANTIVTSRMKAIIDSVKGVQRGRLQRKFAKAKTLSRSMPAVYSLVIKAEKELLRIASADTRALNSGLENSNFWQLMLTVLGPVNSIDNPAYGIKSGVFYATSKSKSASRLIRLKLSNPNLYVQDYASMPGDPTRHPHILDSALKNITNALDLMGVTTTRRRQVRVNQVRLYNQIIRPDVWFVAPPRPNVLFPDDYFELSVAREFLQEVTRMQLTTSMEFVGPNEFLDSRYFAPNIKDITGEKFLQSANAGARIILPHERFTGIVPKFHSMSEANIYAARAEQKKAEQQQIKMLLQQADQLEKYVRALKKGQTGTKPNDELAAQYLKRVAMLRGRARDQKYRIPFLQRIVNFMFFKHRFQKRTLQTQALFSPQIIPGFPMVVLNQPPIEIASDPPQWVGRLDNWSHVGGQEGGSSNVTLTHVREHSKVDDEYLNISKGTAQFFSGGGSKTTRVDVNTTIKKLARYKRDLAGVQKQKLRKGQTRARLKKQLESKVKRLEKMLDAVKRAAAGRSLVGSLGPNGGTISSVDPKGKLAKRGLPLDAAKKYYDQYIIVERYSTKAKAVILPVEEQLFPPWISPAYRNENLGKQRVNGRRGVYQQMYGCDAITTDLGDNPTYLEPPDPDAFVVSSSNFQRLGSFKPSKSIEEAIDELVLAYRHLRDNGKDLHAWLETYRYRPIATLEDMMGSPDLEVNDKGDVVKGKRGFRTWAYGPFENLEGFESKANELDKKGTKVAKGLDTRKDKHDRVLQYVSELRKGVGQLGG